MNPRKKSFAKLNFVGSFFQTARDIPGSFRRLVRPLATLALVARSSGLAISVHSCGQPLGPDSLWWLQERPLVQVANESLKLGLYATRHLLPAWLGLGGAPGDAAQPREDSPAERVPNLPGSVQ